MSPTQLVLLLHLLSRAELIGSRGRARHYGEPENRYSDYDFAIFTDDKEVVEDCRRWCSRLAEELPEQFTLILREVGFTLHSEELDISIAPAKRRSVTYEAWHLMHTEGMDKHEAWVLMNAKYGLAAN